MTRHVGILTGLVILAAACIVVLGLANPERMWYTDSKEIDRQLAKWREKRPARYWLVMEYHEFIGDGIISLTVDGAKTERLTWLAGGNRLTEETARAEMMTEFTPDQQMEGLLRLVPEHGIRFQAKFNREFGYPEEIQSFRRTGDGGWEKEAYGFRVIRFTPLGQ